MQKDQSIISGDWQAEGKTSDGARESVRTKAAKALTALKAAVTDARAQAKILAKEAGAKLGDVVTIGGGSFVDLIKVKHSDRNYQINPPLRSNSS